MVKELLSEGSHHLLHFNHINRQSDPWYFLSTFMCKNTFNKPPADSKYFGPHGWKIGPVWAKNSPVSNVWLDHVLEKMLSSVGLLHVTSYTYTGLFKQVMHLCVPYTHHMFRYVWSREVSLSQRLTTQAWICLWDKDAECIQREPQVPWYHRIVTKSLTNDAVMDNGLCLRTILSGFPSSL